jgi:hypothetical protein
MVKRGTTPAKLEYFAHPIRHVGADRKHFRPQVQPAVSITASSFIFVLCLKMVQPEDYNLGIPTRIRKEVRE